MWECIVNDIFIIILTKTIRRTNKRLDKMKITTSVIAILGWLFLLVPVVSNAAGSTTPMSHNQVEVDSWNLFAQRLYILHQHQIAQREIVQQESKGGYSGGKDFYREVKYIDKKTKNLLSRILWEIDNPEQIHEIEVFVYGKNGKLKRDYLAAFFPEQRNAPIQTLINIHYQNDELKSFRQFDASGDKIYELCEGKFFGEPLTISLDDDDFALYSKQTIQIMESQEYLSCFDHTIGVLGDYVNPLLGISLPTDLITQAEMLELDTLDSVEQKIKQLSKAIKNKKDPSKLYYERGKAYRMLQMFDKAIEDFNNVLKLDDSLDGAYFGRGVAYSRIRMFDNAITDLSVFIKRNPKSSMAYTKRGVTRIWAGKYELAEKDLITAITLGPKNAEAIDDLGVMYARKGNYKQAMEHFKKVVDIDPSYKKGIHNLAMTHYILGDYQASFIDINKALELKPNDKNSLLLKGEIMLKLGMKKEAEAIIDRADFLPEGGWQEKFSLQ